MWYKLKHTYILTYLNYFVSEIEEKNIFEIVYIPIAITSFEYKWVLFGK